MNYSQVTTQRNRKDIPPLNNSYIDDRNRKTEAIKNLLARLEESHVEFQKAIYAGRSSSQYTALDYIYDDMLGLIRKITEHLRKHE